MRHIVMTLMGLWLLTGCAKVTRELQHFPELFNPPVNMVEHNYQAADILINNASPALKLSSPIIVAALEATNLLPGEKTSAFGKVTTDQVATRFVQLGYNVRDLSQNVGDAVHESQRMAIDRASASGADILLTGSYMISQYDILVNLRLVDVKQGRVISATDYRLPLGSDTYQLLGRDPYTGVPEKPRNHPEAAPAMPKMKWSELPVRVIND